MSSPEADSDKPDSGPNKEKNKSDEALFQAWDYARNPRWRRIFIFLAFLPYSYIAISAIYLYIQWDKIPARIPAHFGLFSYQVDRWAHKGFWGVYFWSFFCFIIVSTLTLLFFLILKNSLPPAKPRRVPPVIRAREKLKSIIFLLAFTHYLALTITYLSIALPLFPHLEMKALTRYLSIIMMIVPSALFFVPLYFRLKSRLPISAEDEAKMDEQAQRKYWKLGAFYWNPNDPSIILPNRFGTKYTLNFARGLAWVYIGFIFFPLIVVFTILIVLVIVCR